MQLYDTATRRVVPLAQRDPGKVSIYVCGPTVYAPPHIGHGRQVVVYDVLRRFLEWSGLDVEFVSNITDIDDAIIERANAEGRDPAEIARKCEAVWWEALDRLDVARPDHTPHATEYVKQMIDLVADLVDAGKAYRTSDGVYLSVQSVEDYGLLPHQDLENLREGGGEREIVGTEKRHPADFVLWKLAKEGEPFWPSPWGDGRPGWHTECVAMSPGSCSAGIRSPHRRTRRFSPTTRMSGPRRWPSVRPFAGHWMHHGFVEVGARRCRSPLAMSRTCST